MAEEIQKENELLKKYFGAKSFEDLLQLGESSSPKEVKETIDGINKMMENNSRNITYTQVRNILQLVKNEDYENNISKFFMVIPKLAYIEARPQKNEAGKKIIRFIRELANNVNTDASNYKGFVEILNTIVAFHKLHG